MYEVKTNHISYTAESKSKRNAIIEAKAMMVKALVNHSLVVDTTTGEVVAEFVKEYPKAVGTYTVRQVWGA